MKIGNEIVRFVLALKIDELPQRAEIVTDVQGARGLDSRQDAHDPSNSTIRIESGVMRADHPAAYKCNKVASV